MQPYHMHCVACCLTKLAGFLARDGIVVLVSRFVGDLGLDHCASGGVMDHTDLPRHCELLFKQTTASIYLLASSAQTLPNI